MHSVRFMASSAFMPFLVHCQMCTYTHGIMWLYAYICIGKTLIIYVTLAIYLSAYICLDLLIYFVWRERESLPRCPRSSLTPLAFRLCGDAGVHLLSFGLHGVWTSHFWNNGTAKSSSLQKGDHVNKKKPSCMWRRNTLAKPYTLNPETLSVFNPNSHSH